MQDDELKNLLRKAESDLVDSPLDAGLLAERVRGRWQRGQRRRRVIAVAGPLLLIIAATGLWIVGRRAPLSEISGVDDARQLNRIDVLDTGRDIEQLVAQAEFHRRLARRIAAKLKEGRPRGDIPDTLAAERPEDEIREQLEIVAYRMILRADGLRAAMAPGNEIVVIYRDIVRLFPDTQSAELARRRLTELGASQGAT
jgi:hypothetical protein